MINNLTNSRLNGITRDPSFTRAVHLSLRLSRAEAVEHERKSRWFQQPGNRNRLARTKESPEEREPRGTAAYHADNIRDGDTEGGLRITRMRIRFGAFAISRREVQAPSVLET